MDDILQDVKQWNVLIVDDEPDNLRVAEKVLSFSGATVHTATNGLEGLDVLENIKPTFILLDLSMPKMNGWDMYQAVRDNPRISHIPIIALTAHAMEADQERALEMGFDGYITKPFWMDSFLGEIQDCLERYVTTKR